jgi:hypothetical protein
LNLLYPFVSGFLALVAFCFVGFVACRHSPCLFIFLKLQICKCFNHSPNLDLFYLPRFRAHRHPTYVQSNSDFRLCALIYNPDRLHRICTFSPPRVPTENQKLRLFGVGIFGVEFWRAQPEPKQIP